MKMFSTDSMAATGSSRSWQPSEAALSTALVRPGCRGNSTIISPSLVTRPLLPPKHQTDVKFQQELHKPTSFVLRKPIQAHRCNHSPVDGIKLIELF